MDSLPCCKNYPIEKNIIDIDGEHHDFPGDTETCSAFTPENVLRVKFFLLFFLKLPLFFPLQILYRLYDIATGGFYYRGYENAVHEYRKLRERVVPMSTLIGYVLLELIKDICRIILYPLYFFAMGWAAIIGWFCPVLGMRIACKLDQLYHVQPPEHYTRAGFLDSAGNIATPCMQTKEFRKEMNLFRYYDNYNPFWFQSLRGRLRHLINKASEYFTGEELAPIKAAEMALNPRRDDDPKKIRAMIDTFEAAIQAWIDHNDGYKALLTQAANPPRWNDVIMNKPFQVYV